VSLPELCIPDGIEPIVGWRYWRAEAGWLFSLNRFKTWPAARALEARCSLTDGHAEPPPGERCGCGIYAALDLDTLKEITEPDLESLLVVGEVALWGRVIPADLGYRAQFGYPRCLWVVRESLPALDWTADVPLCLSEMYGIPVETCDARWAVVAGGSTPGHGSPELPRSAPRSHPSSRASNGLPRRSQTARRPTPGSWPGSGPRIGRSPSLAALSGAASPGTELSRGACRHDFVKPMSS